MWKPDANGYLSFPMTPALFGQLTDFRRQRITDETFRAVSSITDPELRGKILEYLRKLFSQTESERMSAAGELLTMTAGSLEKSSQIGTALTRLTGRTG